MQVLSHSSRAWCVSQKGLKGFLLDEPKRPWYFKRLSHNAQQTYYRLRCERFFGALHTGKLFILVHISLCFQVKSTTKSRNKLEYTRENWINWMKLTDKEFSAASATIWSRCFTKISPQATVRNQNQSNEIHRPNEPSGWENDRAGSHGKWHVGRQTDCLHVS